MAIDPKHLPEDPKVLQQMVLDLMAQPEREFTERNKIEILLRELLDARRNRKSEQLSADQLALFAAAWDTRQAEAEVSAKADDSDTVPGSPPNSSDCRRLTTPVADGYPDSPAPLAGTAFRRRTDRAIGT